jgi:hypothetical protein
MPWEVVLWGISYSNLTMLLATIPKIETKAGGAEVVEEVGGLDDLKKFIK